MTKTGDNPAMGEDALEFIDSLLTPEEIAESNARIALIREIKTAQVTIDNSGNN